MTLDQLEEVAEMAAALKRNRNQRKALLSRTALITVGTVTLVGRTQELAREAVLHALQADDDEIKGVLAHRGIKLT